MLVMSENYNTWPSVRIKPELMRRTIDYIARMEVPSTKPKVVNMALERFLKASEMAIPESIILRSVNQPTLQDV
jgi:hypothetical protein